MDGRFDFVKDDENLTSTRLTGLKTGLKISRSCGQSREETGEKKSAFLNISADTETMKKRADMLAEYGWNYAMIDVVVAGTAGS